MILPENFKTIQARDADGNPIYEANGTTPVIVTEDVVVTNEEPVGYAGWHYDGVTTIQGNTVTSQGVVGERPDSQYGLYIGDFVDVPATPLVAGYEFGGWYRDPECRIPWSFERSIVESNMVLYANWKVLGAYIEKASEIARKVTEPDAGETNQQKKKNGGDKQNDLTDEINEEEGNGSKEEINDNSNPETSPQIETGDQSDSKDNPAEEDQQTGNVEKDFAIFNLIAMLITLGVAILSLAKKEMLRFAECALALIAVVIFIVGFNFSKGVLFDKYSIWFAILPVASAIRFVVDVIAQQKK